MNYEKIKKIIDNIIENEYDHVQKENLQGMDCLNEYKKLCSEMNKIQQQLFHLIPIEYHYLVDNLESIFWEMCSIENRFYFKRGVSAGTSNLNFLREITNGVTFY